MYVNGKYYDTSHRVPIEVPRSEIEELIAITSNSRISS